MWEHNYTPVADSLVYSTLISAIPLGVLFYLLGVKRKPSWVAGLSGLAAALVLAIGVYGMPVPQAAASMVNGAAFRAVPHRLDRHRVADPVPGDARHRQVRDHQGLDRRPLR